MMSCIVLPFLLFLSLSALLLLSTGQILRITNEDIDYTFEDYGDEKLLWGKESSPQWCESPSINSTLGDHVTLRSSFIEANSKGQYATETVAEVSCGPERRLKLQESVIHPLNSVHLRCTLNSSGTGGVWLLVGTNGTTIVSSRPGCIYGEPTFHMCELPQLIHRGLHVTAARSSRFFKHNDTLIIKCSMIQNTLHPPGRHTLRCINSQWIHEINEIPSGLKYPICVTRSICTIRQIPRFLHFAGNGVNCNGKSSRCFSRIVPLGTKLELQCRDNTTRLVGPSSVVCLNSASETDSAWYPPKWPNCIPKITCPEPFILNGIYVASEQFNGTFRHGMQVWFKCLEGYILYGSEVIECSKSGLWNNSSPECIADESGSDERSIKAFLLVLIYCLIIILIVMLRAVYRQNQRLRRQCKLARSATEEMLPKCSVGVSL